ncbi:hypothetical protein [Bradyrhizobium elkanii]|uniref:hypothetical protein n=1 Tax=Bradyrhizobium elkanii TaxID=29448 RepID=UPI002227CC54|nr:hypothetical protein [Bradyrhizobium elkanii]MCW2130690.1 hypothetical protein [Bradyrhizobium elkanii]MCW2176041.1 hypothetical protein [Bradyrhizobium elkanii]
MSAITLRDRSIAMAAPATNREPTEDIAWFSQMIEEANLDACEGSDRAPDCKGFDNDPHDLAESGSATSSPLIAGSIVGAMPGPIQHRRTPEELSRSVELAELTRRLTEHTLVSRDYAGGTEVHVMLNRELFGNARVTVSFQPDTLGVCIVSERLWPILQVHGHAFARDLSDLLEMRIVMAVFAYSSTLDEHGSNRRSRGFETLLYYKAEKGA